jgi:Protein of unknown function (DUF1552)
MNSPAILIRSSLSRRSVLRGTGAALALPWLEAMSMPGANADTNNDPANAPTRVAALFFPNGVREDCWTPETEGTDWEPTSQLQPLESLKSEVSVLSGLWHQATDTGDGHYVKDAAWLTGTTIRKTTGVDLNSGGVSMDQVAAKTLGQWTPLPSLELGTQAVRSGVDAVVGYTRVYGSHVSWRTPTQPLAKEINPRLVFDRMTRIASGSPAQQDDKPLLDLVREDAKRLKQRLGDRDRQRIDQYLESVHTLEQRINATSGGTGRTWKSKVDFTDREAPADSPKAHADRVRLMMDMMALAFESDITRVCTFMFGNSVSGENFAFLEGVDNSHHELSHHQNKKEKLDQYELVTTWHVEQYAYLLDKLRSLPEGDSNVLNNSAVLFGSALRDGNKHSPHDLPLLLAGRARGRIAQGQHIRSSNDSPMANLLLTMLQAAGVPAGHFADSSGLIEGLHA